MSKAVEVTRNYSGPDAEMLQGNRVVYNLFITGESRGFIVLDSSFDSVFADNWLAAIETAEQAAQDLAVQDELATLTAEVQSKMEACRNHFQKLKYFIEKAFPSNRSMWNTFGFTEYEKARKSETIMIRFMQTLQIQVTKYAEELLAVNCTQENIDKVGVLKQELLDADQAQELHKKDRLVMTQNRIRKLNTAFEFWRKINKASKIIYANDFARLKQYMLPGEDDSDEEEPESEEKL